MRDARHRGLTATALTRLPSREMDKRETVYTNQLNEGDRIEAVAIVERVEIHGEDVTLHLSDQTTMKADEKVWRHLEDA